MIHFTHKIHAIDLGGKAGIRRGGKSESPHAGGQGGGQGGGHGNRRRRGEGEVRVRGKLWTRFGTKRRRERHTNVAVDPILPAGYSDSDLNVAVDLSMPAAAYSDDLNVEPPQLIVAPMAEETITLYPAPSPHWSPPPPAPPPHSPLLDTGRSKNAAEQMMGEPKVRRSIGNREIVMEDAKTVTEEEERSKVMRGQQKMRRLHLYNEDEEEEKQRRKVEEEEENRKKVEAEMRKRLKVEEEEQRTRRTSPSHRFPSSVRAESIFR